MKTADKAAFTLVELMVVIGLMALLGTISVTGYFAAVRGMNDRAATDDTRSLIRLAMQTCLIDQTPTAVLFYNRQSQVKTDTTSSEEVKATSVGSAVAIKMAGRISFIDQNKKLLVDEFADWNQSYPVKDDKSANQKSKSGVRFYRMADLSKVEGGIYKCSSLMEASVQASHANFDDEYMIASGMQVQEFCRQYHKERNDVENFVNDNDYYQNANSYRFGRRISDDNDGLSLSEWKVGDAYGVEIATLDLPKGYIFGSQAPNSTKIVSVDALSFHPDMQTDFRDFLLDFSGVTISAWRGESFKKVETLSKREDLEDIQD